MIGKARRLALGAWGGKLADLHPVAPNFPPEAPSAKRRAFPIILDKPNVMQAGVNADGGE